MIRKRDGTNDIPIQKLNEGSTGIGFEGTAGVCKGMTVTGARKCTLFLSRFLPSIYDQRDFVSFGEITRYVAVKDDVLFVYGEKNDPTYIYSVPLGTLRAVKEDPSNPHKRSVSVSPGYGTGVSRQDKNIENVILMDAEGELVYQVSLNCKNDKEIADRFIAAVTNINLAENERERNKKE